MKIELNDEARTVAIALIIATAIVSLAVGGWLYYYNMNRAAFAAGYEKATLPGVNDTYWRKAQ